MRAGPTISLLATLGAIASAGCTPSAAPDDASDTTGAGGATSTSSDTSSSNATSASSGNSSSDSSTSASTGSGGGMPLAPCEFVDEFTNMIDPKWNPTGDYDPGGGILNLTVLATDPFAGLSTALFDATECGLSLEVEPTPPFMVGSIAYLSVGDGVGPTNQLNTEIQPGNPPHVVVREMGNEIAKVPITGLPIRIGIALHGTSVYHLYAYPGGDWELLTTTARPLWLDDLSKNYMGLGIIGPTGETASFDHFNTVQIRVGDLDGM